MKAGEIAYTAIVVGIAWAVAALLFGARLGTLVPVFEIGCALTVLGVLVMDNSAQVPRSRRTAF
jgi:xanthine/uracil/vitamin C permease (AzgA family)